MVEPAQHSVSRRNCRETTSSSLSLDCFCHSYSSTLGSGAASQKYFRLLLDQMSQSLLYYHQFLKIFYFNYLKTKMFLDLFLTKLTHNISHHLVRCCHNSSSTVYASPHFLMKDDEPSETFHAENISTHPAISNQHLSSSTHQHMTVV